MSTEQNPTAELALWQVINLLDVRLLDIRATVQPDAPLDPPVPPVLQLDYRGTGRDVPDANRLEVDVHLRVFTGDGQRVEPAADALLHIESTWRVTYSRPADRTPTADELVDFSQRNGVFNVWPYWRELTHSLYGRMGLLFPPLPVFRVGSGADVPAPE